MERIKTKLESGLLVKFIDIETEMIQQFLDSSDFYGYEIEEGLYLFPSQKSEYDILEKGLTADFNRSRIRRFYFEGV